MFPILSIITFLPLLGGIVILFFPKTQLSAIRWTALGIAWMNLLLAIVLMLVYLQANATAGGTTVGNAPSSTFLFNEYVPWVSALGINYSLGVDGISLLLVAYFLVGSWGGERRIYAAIKFVLYTSVGSLLMLAGIIALGYYHQQAVGGSYTLDLTALLNTKLSSGIQLWLLLAFAAAFAVKIPFVPFHSWLPDAYSEAPAPVTVMLAGAMSKTGAYGFLRFCLPLFPNAVQTLAPLFNTLAVIGILYCAVLALVQTDLKRLLGYSSISHLGVVMLGMFAFNTQAVIGGAVAQNVQGMEGSVLQMVNHGITLGALFLIAGFLEERTGTRRLGEFGTLAKRIPILATVMLIAVLSSLGLPGLNSFAGEFLALLGAFRNNVIFGTLGTIVIIPAAWYLIRFFQEVMEGSRQSGRAVGAAERKGIVSDIRLGEFLVLSPLLLLIFYIGVQPAPLTFLMEPSIANTLQSIANAFFTK